MNEEHRKTNSDILNLLQGKEALIDTLNHNIEVLNRLAKLSITKSSLNEFIDDNAFEVDTKEYGNLDVIDINILKDYIDKNDASIID